MLAKLIGRVLLLAFPRRFRDRLGQPLVQTLLTDSRGESGRLAPGRLAAGAVDVVSAGLTERLEQPKRTVRTTIEATWLDLRLALRRLNHSRSFVLVALLTLTLGIGANAALFQLLQAVQRPLAIPSPQQLVELRIENFDNPRGNFTMWRANATNGIWEEIRRRQRAFSGVFAWSAGSARLTADGREPRFASLILVTGGFFSTLGIVPELGRLLTDADDVKGCANPAVVLSHAFWQTEFGGDRRIVGKPLMLGRDSYEIVGVAPRSFTGLDVGRGFDVAAPLCSEWLPPGSSSRLDSGTEWFLNVMGRLEAGWTIDRASAHLASISPAIFDASLPANYPAANVAGYRAFRLGAFDASRGVSAARQRYGEPLWFLQATAILVLLVGCANLANLMLARGATRQREIAARAALGAGRGQLIRVVLAESVLLSIAGAAAGAWLAQELSTALVGFLNSDANPLVLDLSFDWHALGFIALAAVLTCLLSGMAAAWRAGATSATSLLHGGRGLADSRTRVTLRQALVVAQVALSLVLLTGALLFSRSLHNLTSQDIGLRPDGLTIAYVDASGMNVPVEQRAEFRRMLLDRLGATPGVVSVAETSVVPLSGATSGYKIWIDGQPSGSAGERTGSNFADVDGSFFQTIGIPLVAGRLFDARDTPGAPGVAIVNETFVRRLLPDDSSPLGRRVWREATATSPETPYEIVGVVRDSKYRDLRESVRPTLYRAVSQQQRTGTFFQLLIRSSGDVPAGDVVPMLKNAFRQAGPAIVPTFQDYRAMIDRLLVPDRLLAGLSVFFGGLAALLATLGLYGSVSFAVSRRTSEIGLRMALGASRPRIVRMILSEAFVLVIVGCAAGGALAVTLARAVGSRVYGLAPNDPATLAGACVFLALIAFAASAAPARRASRLDPMTAFRVE